VSSVCEVHGHSNTGRTGRARQYCPGCEQEMVQRTRNGETLAEIAADFGLTRERVRQIVVALAPQAACLGRAVRADQARAAREVRERAKAAVRAERLRSLSPCVVCWGPIKRPPNMREQARYHTCSKECCRLWSLVRLHLDPQYHERHDLLMARWSIEKGQPGQIVHAINLLTGNARRHPNRHHPYSAKVVGLLAEVERLREGKSPPSDALPVPKFTYTIEHGTERGYSQGCRLECCRAAHTEYARQLRMHKVSSEGGGVVSGDGFGSQWEQDQTELGGTRAAATIQNENTNSPVDNFREITSRDPATQDTDGDDR
jgi:Sigma-70, region 4